MNLEKATIVHFVDKDQMIFTRHRSIYIKSKEGLSKIIKLPFVFPRDLNFNIRLIERFTRADKCHISKISNNCILIIRGSVVYLWKNELIKIGTIKGDCPLHSSSSIANSGNIYFGEYFMNPKRISVNIYRVNPILNNIEVAYTFPSGSIRHVHCITKDTYFNNRLWVTVGDENGECFLYWTDDEFNSLNKIGDGSQLWRAVGLIFTKTHVCWGTDSPNYDNHFIRMQRSDNTIEIGQKVPGTIWYTGTTNDGLHYASCSVENGKAIRTQEALVYISRNALNWEIASSFRKDIWPMPIFKWGTISFPSGNFNSKNIWISGEALKKLDGCSKLLYIENENYESTV